jgi:general secretion pathway protein K
VSGGPGHRDRGFAVIAALAVAGIIADTAIEALATGRADLAAASAELRRAQLEAEAEAALAVAAHDLALADPAARWPADGQTRALSFGPDTLLIDAEDEGGKIPLNFVTAPDLVRLFELAGAEADQAQRLSESLVRLRDGFPGADPAAHGPLSSLDELGLLPDMTPELFARVAPAVTLAATNLSFDSRVASPLAAAVMAPGASTVFPAAAPPGPAGTPPPAKLVTLRIEVRGSGRTDRLVRTAVVEFTGAPARAVLIRTVE